MIWIELLGPSGIGKSYIYKKLLERDAVRPAEYIGCPNNWLTNSNLAKSYIARKFYRELHNFKFKEENIDILTKKVFQDGLNTYTDDIKIKDKMFQYYQYKFKEIKYLSDKLKSNDIFFSEDGILHLNYGVTAENIKEILRPDFIINLTASDEFINQNRLKRIAGNESNIIEQQTSEEELQKVVFPKNIALYKKKVNVLREFYKNNFFELNIQDQPSEMIIQKIEEIIKWIKN